MVVSYFKQLFKHLSESRWIQAYFSLVLLQTIISIPILIKTLVNAKVIISKAILHNYYYKDPLSSSNALFGDTLDDKGYKVVYENVLFLVFEVWRLWTLIDGIAAFNSLTVLASAWFSLLSCVFDLMSVVESEKWISRGYNITLKVENLHLQIALTVVMGISTVFVIITAFKSKEVIGWQVFRKIGSCIELKNMYYTVEGFELVLKVDILFEVVLLVCLSIIVAKTEYVVIFAVMAVLVSFTLIVSRVSVTRESRWMLTVCLAFQVLLFASNVIVLIELFRYDTYSLWYIGITYVLASIVCIFATLYFGIRCQLNFGKDLKPFVKWYPFQSTVKYSDSNKNSSEASNSTQERPFVSTNQLQQENTRRMAIDDDDEESLYDNSITESGSNDEKQQGRYSINNTINPKIITREPYYHHKHKNSNNNDDTTAMITQPSKLVMTVDDSKDVAPDYKIPLLDKSSNSK